MTTFHEFEKDKVQAAIEAARNYYADRSVDHMAGAPLELADDGHLSLSGGCISVTIENGKVCLNLPLHLGKHCIPIPSVFPNGTAAQACLHICTTWHIPTGVKVTISVAGHVVATKTFGKC